MGIHRLRTVATVGESFPLTSTANGKASLALLDDESQSLLSIAQTIKALFTQ